LGPEFEVLRPAIERLARARPLERRLTREALTVGEGTLAIIAGDLEAVVQPPVGSAEPAAAELDRARMERDLAEAEAWLIQARERLANEAFVSKAPPAVVAGARDREAELVDQVERLRDRLAHQRSTER
jgi:valyl-tRNA synthetase